ncbi:MAG: hypothetical protein N4A40_11675 [Tissierellales bacterium]|jgi:hypothetical protein|nr:hypothetical protein [Tissierellales bacterium]
MSQAEQENQNPVEEKEKKEKKPLKIGKLIITLLMVTIIIPIGVFFALYNLNEDFNKSATKILRQMPAPFNNIGRNDVEKLEELKEKVMVVSDYYLTLDPEQAAEKLANVKNSDEELYYNIVQAMREKSSRKTDNIISKVQVIDLRNDTLEEIYKEIDQSKAEELKTRVEQVTALDDYYAMKFIKENYLDAGAIDELVTLLKQIDNQKVAYWMYFMNPADQVEIMNKIDRPYKNALRTILYDMKSKDDNLMNKANVFEVKDLDTTLSEIGSAEFYPVEDLAVIYSNLSLTKSSEVLKNVSDEEFKKNLLESISKREKLTSDSNKIAENLEKTLDYLQEYDKKIQELADIYNRMTTAEVVKIVEKMMINDQRLEYFDMNGIEGIELTDEKIILDILDKLGKTKVSEIINQLDTRKATELTRKLAIQ